MYLLVRVTIAMGLEWISGLLFYFIPHSSFIRYTFIILVSFHGLWILLSTLTLGGLRDKWLPSCVSMVSSGRNLLSSWRTNIESRCSAKGASSAEEVQISVSKTIDSSSSCNNALDQNVISPGSLINASSQTVSSLLRSDSVDEAKKLTSSTKAIKLMCGIPAGPSVSIEEVGNEPTVTADEQDTETNFSSIDG